MASCPAGFAPKVCSQVLSRGSGSSDCGPCVVIEALYAVSCGKFIIGGRERRVELIKKIRQLGGADPDKGATTTNAQMRKAYLSTYFANQFAALGLRPPGAGKERDDAAWSDLVDVLQSGKWASISIRYSVINDYLGGRYSGDCAFQKGHQWLIGRYRSPGGTPYVTVVDPLLDGRYSGGCQAKVLEGPQALPLSLVKDASEAWSGTNQWSGFPLWTVGLLPSNEPPGGSGTVAVPNVVNSLEAGALSSLGSAGLIAGNRDEDYSATVGIGRVISTFPTAGTTVQKGSEVDYVVSLGAAPVVPSIDPNPADPCNDPSGDTPPCGCGG